MKIKFKIKHLSAQIHVRVDFVPGKRGCLGVNGEKQNAEQAVMAQCLLCPCITVLPAFSGARFMHAPSSSPEISLVAYTEQNGGLGSVTEAAACLALCGDLPARVAERLDSSYSNLDLE